jgi:hypothetical protein
MEEKRIDELRKFIGIITDPRISAFIDLKKLCNSGSYNLCVRMATEHAAQHGDFGYLNRLLALLQGTKHASDLVTALRSKLRFVVVEGKPPKLKKATPQLAGKAAKQPAVLQPAAKPATEKRPLSKAQKKMDRPAASDDLMDSRLMLPGCYGMGRRR